MCELFLLFRIINGTLSPNETTQQNQCHCWHGHHTVVHITHLIETLRDNLKTEQASISEEFTNCTDNNEYQSITKTITDTIKEAGPRSRSS